MPGEDGSPAQEGMQRGLDTIGWFIATLHQMLGHDKAAAVLGEPPLDKEACLICQYEKDPTPEGKQAVIEALAPRPEMKPVSELKKGDRVHLYKTVVEITGPWYVPEDEKFLPGWGRLPMVWDGLRCAPPEQGGTLVQLEEAGR